MVHNCDMVDKKKPDQAKPEASRHYTNELCELSTEKADEVVGRSLKLYVSTQVWIIIICLQFTI